MVNGNEQYLQELYDHVGDLQDEWEMQESAQETLPVETYTETYQFVNGSFQRVGGSCIFTTNNRLTIGQPCVNIVVC